MIRSASKDFDLTGLVNSSSDAFRSARASRSRTKRRLSLILTSPSNTASAAAFTSTTNPRGPSVTAGKRIELSASMADVHPSAPATAAISIQRRVKEVRIRSSSVPNWQTSELFSNMTLHYLDEIVVHHDKGVFNY